MNEKIKELAEQARVYANENEQHWKLGPSWDSLFEAKFAELIIAKCIEEAGEPGDGLIKGDTWHDGVRASVWSIKQHFGI